MLPCVPTLERSWECAVPGTTTPGSFVLHGLTAFHLASADRWIRLDARGNKGGVGARFSLNGEHLAWPVDPSQGEIDYPVVDASPHPTVVSALATARLGRRSPGCRGLRRPSDGTVTARY